ncbi:MAG: DciA family protein [Steroidobacteraceae bacterium]
MRNNPKSAKTAPGPIRSKGKPLEIKDLLAKAGLGQQRIAAAADRVEDWKAFLATLWGDELAGAVTQVSVREGCLTLHARNAAWSARLRYAVAEHWSAIVAREPSLKKSLVRIQPAAASAGGRT